MKNPDAQDQEPQDARVPYVYEYGMYGFTVCGPNKKKMGAREDPTEYCDFSATDCVYRYAVETETTAVYMR